MLRVRSSFTHLDAKTRAEYHTREKIGIALISFLLKALSEIVNASKFILNLKDGFGKIMANELNEK